jgi:hypothetical protein
MITGYKWLKDDMRSANGCEPPWEIGVWKKTEEPLVMCSVGYHASENPVHSLKYKCGNRLFIVEADGTLIKDEDKFVASEMRIVQELPAKEIIIQFALACAKNCLFRFEGLYPDDPRPRQAIEAVEKYIAGIIEPEVVAYAADAAAHAVKDTAATASNTAVAVTAAYAAADCVSYVIDAVFDVVDCAVAAYIVADCAAASYAAAAYAATNNIDGVYDAAYYMEKKWQRKKLERIIAGTGFNNYHETPPPVPATSHIRGKHDER